MHSLVSVGNCFARAVHASAAVALLVCIIALASSCAVVHQHESCDSTFAYTDFSNPGHPQPVYVCRPVAPPPAAATVASP